MLHINYDECIITTLESKMKTITLKNKLEKFTEVKSNGKLYFSRNENKEISWWDQGGEAICLRVRGLNDKDDMQSDYTAGSFYDTAKHAIKSFKGE